MCIVSVKIKVHFLTQYNEWKSMTLHYLIRLANLPSIPFTSGLAWLWQRFEFVIHLLATARNQISDSPSLVLERGNSVVLQTEQSRFVLVHISGNMIERSVFWFIRRWKWDVLKKILNVVKQHLDAFLVKGRVGQHTAQFHCKLFFY